MPIHFSTQYYNVSVGLTVKNTLFNELYYLINPLFGKQKPAV